MLKRQQALVRLNKEPVKIVKDKQPQQDLTQNQLMKIATVIQNETKADAGKIEMFYNENKEVFFKFHNKEISKDELCIAFLDFAEPNKEEKEQSELPIDENDNKEEKETDNIPEGLKA